MINSETFVKEILPSIKKQLVKLLYFKHKVKQKEIAEKLYISQALVSYYINDKRAIKNFEIESKIKNKLENFASKISMNNISKKEIEEFYEEIKNCL
ncbi:MAG: hypothetical protein QXG91_01620 [Candidatus Aenigmatarchaeota archaeon]